MPVDVSATLRQALSRLEVEKARIDRQIVGLRKALSAVSVAGLDGAGSSPAGSKRRRKRMSSAERKAVGARMKAYWAKRRGRKGTSAQKKK